jgi:anti-sigma factor RsiW
VSAAEHTPSELLSAFVDGELGGLTASEAAAAQAVSAHVAECAFCTGEVARFAQVRAAVRGAASPVLAPGWEDQLIAQVDYLGRGTVIALRRRVAATAAAVAAVVAAAIFSFLPHDPTASPSVGRMVVSHATSAGAGDPSRLAPASAVAASFGGR